MVNQLKNLSRRNEMALVRWQPNRSFGFGSEVDRLVDHFWRGTPAGSSADQVGTSQSWTPSVDVAEDDENFVVTAELPGVEAGDVKVTVEDDVLTIAGEKTRESESGEGEGRTHRIERSYGRFLRSFRLPAVDAEKISAAYSNGILTISLPKAETAKPKQITVSVN
jgi:HSP20 family protein